jgi:hypothetical protein
MHASTTYNWDDAVTVLRWIARGLCFIAGGVCALSVMFQATYGPVQEIVVFWMALLGAAVFVIAWAMPGIGELIGGPIFVIGPLVLLLLSLTYGQVSLLMLLYVVAFIISGTLFFACGWYKLDQRRHHAPHATV